MAEDVAIVIPCRLHSTRLPGKPLLRCNGKPLVQWTYERASQVPKSRVLVATCDREIEEAVKAFGGEVMMTPESLPTGTHRTAWAVEADHELRMADTIISLQVDEPCVRVEDLVSLANSCIGEDIVTLVAPLSEDDVGNWNTVKAAYSSGTCYWFMRQWVTGAVAHVGVYAFNPSIMRFLVKNNPTRLSQMCSLEQLAWIENGWEILGVEIDPAPLSINCLRDWEQFLAMQSTTNTVTA